MEQLLIHPVHTFILIVSLDLYYFKLTFKVCDKYYYLWTPL